MKFCVEIKNVGSIYEISQKPQRVSMQFTLNILLRMNKAGA